MNAPLTQHQLNERIAAFLERKSKRFPDMDLGDHHDTAPISSEPRGGSTWFRKPNLDR